MSSVVVTGLGLWTPIGKTIVENWNTLTHFSVVPDPNLTEDNWQALRRPDPPPSRGREVATGDRERVYGETLSSLSRPCGAALPREGGGHNGFAGAKRMAEAAAYEALTDAGLWDDERLACDPERMGCTVSVSKPLWSSSSSGNQGSWLPPEGVNDFLRKQFGLQGESRNVIAACATGAYSIALAASWIEQGLCDAVLAGSVEPAPHLLMEAGFRNMGVLTDDTVMRPFDRRRSGFVFGAGAGICVLESEEHIRQRERNGGQRERRLTWTSANVNSGDRNLFKKDTTRRRSRWPPLPFTAVHVGRRSKPYATLSGWALGADPHSAVAFNSNGRHIADVIERVLARARLSAGDVSYVHAHGTATRLNDWIETQALLKAFGPQAGRLMISATKASTGHLLGAAGSAGFIFSVLALKNQFVPPTATLEEKDPECPLDYTPGRGHAARFEHAMSLSFGFGGPIGALVASR